jgi:PPM family protein phosphatase
MKSKLAIQLSSFNNGSRIRTANPYAPLHRQGEAFNLMNIRFAASSDLGRVRKKNEDSFLAAPHLSLFAVADGMGGHASGEIASRLAVDTLREHFSQASATKDRRQNEDETAVLSPASNFLVRAFRLVNEKIYRASQERSETRGMGTTLVAVYFSHPSPLVAHVGDSRLYHLTAKSIHQVTEDHSLVWEQYKKGLLSKEDLPSSPQKNIITRALGIKPDVDVELKTLSLEAGDYLLLCTDGLSDMLREEQILRAVHEASGDLTRACSSLVSLANTLGGKDNITALLIQIGGSSPSS